MANAIISVLVQVPFSMVVVLLPTASPLCVADTTLALDEGQTQTVLEQTSVQT